MISVIITSYKEPNTIAKAIASVASKDHEIIQISPDRETLDAGLKEGKRLKLEKNFVQIKDPCKGKPHALNLAFKKAKGEILVLTDGDVFFDKGAVSKLTDPFKNNDVGGVSGRPVSRDSKDNMMGYFGHLLSDAAHHKREFCQKRNLFFPMSGYIMAVRNYGFELPEDVLSDDAYISYVVENKNKKIAYVKDARAFVKYPTNLNDYYKQKVRSLGGYTQLEGYGVVKKEKRTRTLGDELSYFWFPFSYASNIKEFFWSILLFPIRFFTWVRIFFDRKVFKKNFEKSWTRVESTK